MRLASGLILCVFLASACADDPPPKKDPPKASAVKLDLGKPLTAPVGKRLVVAAVTTAARVTWELPPGVDGLPLDGKRLALWAPPGTYVVRGMVPSGEDVLSDEVVVTVTGPRPPPVPPGPNPPVPPQPVKSFRVIFVVESGDGLTPDQVGVVYGVQVENWLAANCTGGREGFRRRDKDTVQLAGPLKAVWDAARPSIRKTPCVVVERNGHIEIVDVGVTPAAMLAVLQEYLDGKRGK